MDVPEEFLVVGENIDRLVTLEIRPRNNLTGVIGGLYGALREKLGQPLSLLAARRLMESVKARDVVIIATGAGQPPYLARGETDGPPGAVALARALHLGLGAVPVLVGEERYLGPIEASARAIGLSPQPFEVARGMLYATSIVPLPLGSEEGALGRDLFSKYNPKAVIAVEKPGANRAGVRHSATGLSRPSELFARLEELFEEARRRGVLTIGIGDNGNEIGFGTVEEAVRRYQRFGERCRCPCGQGVACATPADVVVVTGTSNWGAYGVEAALALLLGNPRLIHDGTLERRVVDACSQAGAADGATGMLTPTVDGTPLWLQGHLVELLSLLVEHATVELRREF